MLQTMHFINSKKALLRYSQLIKQRSQNLHFFAQNSILFTTKFMLRFKRKKKKLLNLNYINAMHVLQNFSCGF